MTVRYHVRAYHVRTIDWAAVVERRRNGEMWKVIAADYHMHDVAFRRRYREWCGMAHAKLDRMLRSCNG